MRQPFWGRFNGLKYNEFSFLQLQPFWEVKNFSAFSQDFLPVAGKAPCANKYAGRKKFCFTEGKKFVYLLHEDRKSSRPITDFCNCCRFGMPGL